jgi:hypothetical protein
MGVGMVDGFHWMRVTSKQLRFLYEDVTTLPPPPQMTELAAAIDRRLEAEARVGDPPTTPREPTDT